MGLFCQKENGIAGWGVSQTWDDSGASGLYGAQVNNNGRLTFRDGKLTGASSSGTTTAFLNPERLASLGKAIWEGTKYLTGFSEGGFWEKAGNYFSGNGGWLSNKELQRIAERKKQLRMRAPRNPYYEIEGTARDLDKRAGFWGRTKERFSNFFDGKGFTSNGELLLSETERAGVAGAIRMKEQLGLPLTALEEHYKAVLDLAAAQKQNVLRNCNCITQSGAIDREKMSAAERYAYNQAVKMELTAEYSTSRAMYADWAAEGRTDVPLTPYSKIILKDNYPSLDLDDMRIVNSGAWHSIWTKASGGVPITPGCCRIYSPDTSKRYPGGFDQFSQSGIQILAHELTHPVQNSGLVLGFVGRYVGMEKLTEWVTGWDSYDTSSVFGVDWTKIQKNPARIIGHESDWWYTDSKSNSSYSSYDSWAEMMRENIDYRMSKELRLYSNLKPKWEKQDKKIYIPKSKSNKGGN